MEISVEKAGDAYIASPSDAASCLSMNETIAKDDLNSEEKCEPQEEPEKEEAIGDFMEEVPGKKEENTETDEAGPKDEEPDMDEETNADEDVKTDEDAKTDEDIKTDEDAKTDEDVNSDEMPDTDEEPEQEKADPEEKENTGSELEMVELNYLET